MSDLYKPDMSIRFDVAGVEVEIAPRWGETNAFLDVVFETPIGRIEAVFSMPKETYFELHDIVRRHGVIPKIADVLEGRFGYRVAGFRLSRERIPGR